MNYKKVPTSAEVWAVIRARHPAELQVFGTISEPAGNPHGDPTVGLMVTSYGFPGGDFPVIEARTTWDIVEGQPSYKRTNEKHEYWLCHGVEETQA
jgi:hypothetical protein